MTRPRLSLRAMFLVFLVAPVIALMTYHISHQVQTADQMADRFGRKVHERQADDFARSIEFEMRVADAEQLQQRVAVMAETPDAVEVVVRNTEGHELAKTVRAGTAISHSVKVPVVTASEGKFGPRVLGYVEIGWSNESAETVAREQSQEALLVYAVVVVILLIVALLGWRIFSGWLNGISQALQQIVLGRSMTPLDARGVPEVEDLNRHLLQAAGAIDQQRSALVEFAAAHRRLLFGLAQETLERIRLTRELLALVDQPRFAGRARDDIARLTESIEHLSEQVRSFATDSLPGSVLYVGASDSAATDTGSVLRQHGFTWLQAETTESALGKFVKTNPDVVILDHADGKLTRLIREVEAKQGKTKPTLIIATNRGVLDADDYIDGLAPYRVAAAVRAASVTAGTLQAVGKSHEPAPDHASEDGTRP